MAAASASRRSAAARADPKRNSASREAEPGIERARRIAPPGPIFASLSVWLDYQDRFTRTLAVQTPAAPLLTVYRPSTPAKNPVTGAHTKLPAKLHDADVLDGT